MVAKPNTEAGQPHHVPPVDGFSSSTNDTLYVRNLPQLQFLNWEPENPTSRALDTGAMNRDVARVEAKGRMTSPILVMRAVRTRRSCPQQGGDGSWQPSEEGGRLAEMLPSHKEEPWRQWLGHTRLEGHHSIRVHWMEPPALASAPRGDKTSCLWGLGHVGKDMA